MTWGAARRQAVGRRALRETLTGVVLLVLLAGCGGQAPTATTPPPTATAPAQALPATATALAATTTANPSAAGTPETTGGSAGAEATRPTHGTPATGSPVPAGFKLYSGRLPFTVAYPATWTVDESHSDAGQIYFYAPGVTGPLDNATWVEIGTAGPPATDNLDESRDQFYNDQFHAHPEAALDVLRHAQYAGLDFATAGVVFTDANENCYATLGVAMKGPVLWQFRLNTRYSDYELATTRYFAPMLRSLTITSSP